MFAHIEREQGSKRDDLNATIAIVADIATLIIALHCTYLVFENIFDLYSYRKVVKLTASSTCALHKFISISIIIECVANRLTFDTKSNESAYGLSRAGDPLMFIRLGKCSE